MRTEDQVAAMQCPVCRVPLAMSDRQGIEIDYCPQCRGVWLDRGELDKIIERSAPEPERGQGRVAPASPQPSAPLHQSGGQGGFDHGGYGHGGHAGGHAGGYGGKPHKKRKSWMEEIFD